MRIAITGARGFIARNLKVRLMEKGYRDVVEISHDIDDSQLLALLQDVELLFHLSGVNRPQDPQEFTSGNIEFTRRICAALHQVAPKTKVVFSSSIQAELDNPYGQSKKIAENVLLAHGVSTGASVSIYRLTNVFGKWSRPNYNSVVATFCYNISRELPIVVNNPEAALKLVYIDDVCNCFLNELSDTEVRQGFVQCQPEYETTVGEVAEIIENFHESRTTLITARVGTGLTRALYSTYVAAFDPQHFSYDVPMYIDPRGTFSEMLKTPDCGQFSFFTALPGVTRGEHYHHSKTEKFLVIKGKAHFGFRHIETDERYEIVANGEHAQIVETVPGWTHNITNIGDDEMIVMLWANEIFDRDNPDTIAMKVSE